MLYASPQIDSWEPLKAYDVLFFYYPHTELLH